MLTEPGGEDWCEVFEAAWFFVYGIPPYAVGPTLESLAAWAIDNVPRQRARARPLLVDTKHHLWFLNADGTLDRVSETPKNSPSQWERYWRTREGITRWRGPVHPVHSARRRAWQTIRVRAGSPEVNTAGDDYLRWLERQFASGCP